jgi:recombination protein RecT
VFGERGEIVGAYAIATDSAGNMYRETMDMIELEKVHQASKQPNSGVWKTWATEMYRKAVAKRLFKQLPLISAVAEVIDRDNEQFDMNKPVGPSQAAQDVQAAIRLVAPSPENKVRFEPPQEAEPMPVDDGAEWVEEEEFGGQQPDF